MTIMPDDTFTQKQDAKTNSVNLTKNDPKYMHKQKNDNDIGRTSLWKNERNDHTDFWRIGQVVSETGKALKRKRCRDTIARWAKLMRNGNPFDETTNVESKKIVTIDRIDLQSIVIFLLGKRKDSGFGVIVEIVSSTYLFRLVDGKVNVAQTSVHHNPNLIEAFDAV
jgi:uncharacterized 2Fe-2S/4Fe-4S cluster protein (DUF4445 family)